MEFNEEFTYMNINRIGAKVVNYQHHIKFLTVCRLYNITPNGLVIKKMPCVRTSSEGFMRGWNEVLRTAEIDLVNKLIDKNNRTFKILRDNFMKKFNELWSLGNFKEICDLMERLKRTEEQLSKRRFGKIMQLTDNLNVETVKKSIKIEEPFTKELHGICKQRNIYYNRTNEENLGNTSSYLSNIDLRDIYNSLLQEDIPIITVNRDMPLTIGESTNVDYVPQITQVGGSGAHSHGEGSINHEQEEDDDDDVEDLAYILAGLSDDSQSPSIEPTPIENSIGETTQEIPTVANQRISGRFVSDNVFNLSQKVLSADEIKLLSRGLKFVPTPRKMDRWQIKKDIERLGRAIRLKMFFHDKQVSESFSEVPAFRPPSTWNPNIMDAKLEVYLSVLENELVSINEEGFNYPNLTRGEREALQTLMDDESIIIKPADKGSAIVVWDRDDYILEASNQLSEEDVYHEISDDTLKDINGRLLNIIRRMKNDKELDQATFNHLLVNKPQFGKFYLLPKIHKRMGDIKKDIPGRPVISNIGTATEKISGFLDFYLKDLIPNIPHILEDTRDFVNRLKDIGDLPENAILVSFDVVGLYPHIPHADGLKAMEYYLKKFGRRKISTKSLCDLGEFILTNNFFEFGEKKFHQKLGTAIGTKFAPTYANLFMAALEEHMLNDAPYKPHTWFRYLDDVFCVWTHGEEKLEEFFEFLNGYHATIKFTKDVMKNNNLNFLDVLVKKEGVHLHTDLYSKEVDTHQYLHAKSCHPRTCKNAIAYGQALRLKRICSDEETLNKRFDDLKTWMVARGYKEDVVASSIARTEAIDRNTLLLKRPKNNEVQPITLTLTYHPALNKVRDILKKAQVYANSSPLLKSVLPSPPRIAFRNSKSIRDKLVRSRLKPLTSPEPGVHPCGNPRCEIDEVLKVGSTFMDKSGERQFRINHHLSCGSEGVVYLFTCKGCGKQYVGSTTTKFRLRFNQYKSNIKLYGEGRRGFNQERLLAHFFLEGHNGSYKDISVQIIDYCDPNDPERREDYWICQLNTMAPNGLNHKRVVVK